MQCLRSIEFHSNNRYPIESFRQFPALQTIKGSRWTEGCETVAKALLDSFGTVPCPNLTQFIVRDYDAAQFIPDLHEVDLFVTLKGYKSGPDVDQR